MIILKCDNCESQTELQIAKRNLLNNLIDLGWDIDMKDHSYHICAECMSFTRKLDMIRNNARDTIMQIEEERVEQELQTKMKTMTYVEEFDHSDDQPIPIIDVNEIERATYGGGTSATTKTLPVWECRACDFWLPNSMKNYHAIAKHEREKHKGLMPSNERGLKCRACNYVKYIDDYNGATEQSKRTQCNADILKHELENHEELKIARRQRRQQINRRLSFRKIAQ